MMLFKDTKTIICIPEGDTNFFHIVAEVFEGDIF